MWCSWPVENDGRCAMWIVYTPSVPRFLQNQPLITCSWEYDRRMWIENDDDLLAAGLGNILDCPISDLSSMQAACGIQSGGLGLRSAVDLALPAFIASRTDCKQYVQELISNLFNDDLGDKFMDSYNNDVDTAIHSLKTKFSAGAGLKSTCAS